MEKMQTVIAAGGIVKRDNKILLVKITYGANTGMWVLPGGLVDAGESIEDVALREVFEEAKITAEIIDIAAVRTSVRVFDEYDQSNIYIAFSMDYVDGEATADMDETSDAKFFSTDEIQQMDNIVELSREIILGAKPLNGLNEKHVNFDINNKYKNYKLYL